MNPSAIEMIALSKLTLYCYNDTHSYMINTVYEGVVKDAFIMQKEYSMLTEVFNDEPGAIHRFITKNYQHHSFTTLTDSYINYVDDYTSSEYLNKMFPNLGEYVPKFDWSDLIDIGWAETPGTSNDKYIFKEVQNGSYNALFFLDYVFTYPIIKTVSSGELLVYEILSSLEPGTYSHQQLSAIIVKYLSPLSYYFKLYCQPYENEWSCSPETMVAVLLEAMRTNASHLNNIEQVLFNVQHTHFNTNLNSEHWFLPLQSVLGHALMPSMELCKEINETAYQSYLNQFFKIQKQIIYDWGSVLFTEFCCATAKPTSTEEYLMTQIIQFQSGYSTAKAHLLLGQQIVSKSMTCSYNKLAGPAYIHLITNLE
jgi:hypothetical protein